MKRHHVKDRVRHEPDLAENPPRDPEEVEHEKDEVSLDLVQRVVASVLAVVVGGGIAVLLAGFTALDVGALERGSVLGLWVMSGIAGLLTAAAVLVINRRHPYSPLLAFGLLPMVVSAFWVLT
jgi:hypothetical protein